MNILIRNLSKIVTEEKLLESFRPFGVVTSVTIVMDKVTGLSKGFGFVEMPDQHEGEAAIRALDRTRILKDKVKVKKTNAKLRSDNLPEQNKPQTTAEQPILRQDSGVTRPAQTKRPMFKPGYIKPGLCNRFKNRGERDGGSFDSKTADNGNSISKVFADKNVPYLATNSKSYCKIRVQHHSRQISSNTNSKFSPRETVRQEFKPRSERPFGSHSSGGRSSKPYGQSGDRDNSSRPAWPAPRGERPAYKTFSKPFDPKRRDNAPSQFPSRDTVRKEYSPRGEKPSSTHNSGERSSKPFSKFTKSNNSRPSWPAPRGARPRFR